MNEEDSKSDPEMPFDIKSLPSDSIFFKDPNLGNQFYCIPGNRILLPTPESSEADIENLRAPLTNGNDLNPSTSAFRRQMEKKMREFNLASSETVFIGLKDFVNMHKRKDGNETLKDPKCSSVSIEIIESHKKSMPHRRFHKHLKKYSPYLKVREIRLQNAVSLNNVEYVQELLEAGCDARAVDYNKRTLLHVAAANGYSEIVRLLLAYGADPNKKDGIGNTPLHLATCISHIPTVILLLNAGTDLDQLDNQGYSPLQMAMSRLRLLQREKNYSSESTIKQVKELTELMIAYRKCKKSREADLLECFEKKLSLSDPDTEKEVEKHIGDLLSAVENLKV